MIGLNQSTRESQKPFYEYLRMEVTDDGSIVYFASPMGRDETPFAVKELSDQAVVFENLDNEFPQRIIYRREGDQLKALIEGVRSDGQTLSQQWDFQLLPHR